MADKVAVNNYCEVARKQMASNTGASTSVLGAAWDLGLSSRDLMALVIARIEVDWQFFADQAVVEDGCLALGLFGRNYNGLSPEHDLIESPSTYWYASHILHLAAADMQDLQGQVFDYSTLPGGGLIVPARPLYYGTWQVNYAATVYAELTMYYRLVQLDQANMLDLIQVMQGVGLA